MEWSELGHCKEGGVRGRGGERGIDVNVVRIDGVLVERPGFIGDIFFFIYPKSQEGIKFFNY